jgi:diguanylate cyclase (GGDEF)-like protein
LVATSTVVEEEQSSLEARLDSYRRLADIFHYVLAEQDLEPLLERIAEALAELIPHDTLNVYRADERARILTAIYARDRFAEQVLNSTCLYGQGITGWAVENRVPMLVNAAHLDPRVDVVPGTSLEPESLLAIPLIARGAVQGVLNIYREGEEALFTEGELDLAARFGDAAALALHNAQKHELLERQAQTDSLTGLHNHRYFYERLRAELTRADRSADSVSLLMLDIDDFKMLNDVYGHGVGDQVLTGLAGILKEMLRACDVACRIGGEEFTIVLPSCEVEDAFGLAARIQQRLAETSFGPASRITISLGVAQGPLHATNPRELVACADAALMTAKAQGKNRVVVFSEQEVLGPHASTHDDRGVRSIAHLKMLQSLAGKLNQSNDVKKIASTIAEELRSLIDYHNCRVYVAVDNVLVPVALRGELTAYEGEEEEPEVLTCEFGEGITGMAAQRATSLLIPNALECDFAVDVPGTDEIEESMIATPLTYGARVIGVVVISKLGIAQFDGDDVRLLEVLAGNASVAFENARLYQAQRREAENAKALLLFADAMAKAPSLESIAEETTLVTSDLLGARLSGLWLLDAATGTYTVLARASMTGPAEVSRVRRVRKEEGRHLLVGRAGPFLAAVEDHPALHVEDGGEGIVAVAPLVGLDGWIVARPPVAEGIFFTPDRLQLLSGICYQASLAMQRTLSYKAQRQSAEVANALLDFSRELAAAEGMDVVLERLAEQVARVLGASSVVVWLHDHETRVLKARGLWGYDAATAERVREANLEGPLAERLAAEGSPSCVDDGEDLELLRAVLCLDEDKAVCISPLHLGAGGTGGGCISVAAGRDLDRDATWMKLLAGIADQAKLAVNSVASFMNLEVTFLATVEALANALEANDEYTSSHARWITDMSLEVGRAIDMVDGAALKDLELGALFHDIGKIGIPHSILHKPGPLTEQEWGVMKTHPELGERILAPIERLSSVGPIVRHCHERFDGLGYPDGKKGEEVPIESRIIFVCDAFHAMTTDRPYRTSLGVDEACRRLLDNAGTQFDPRIVEAFTSLLRQRPELAEGL